MARRNPWNGPVSKAAVLSVAAKIETQTGLSRRQALRRALSWARKKATPASPEDRYAAMRRQGVYSPRDRSAEGCAHFSARRAPGSLSLSHWSGR